MSWLWRTVILNLVCFLSSKPWFLPQHKYFSSYPIECCDILKTQLLLKFISDENRTLCQSTYLKVQGRKSLDQPDKGVLSHISHGRCVMGEFPFQTRACALLSWGGGAGGGERNSLSCRSGHAQEGRSYCPEFCLFFHRWWRPVYRKLLRRRGAGGGGACGAGKENEGLLW